MDSLGTAVWKFSALPHLPPPDSGLLPWPLSCNLYLPKADDLNTLIRQLRPFFQRTLLCASAFALTIYEVPANADAASEQAAAAAYAEQVAAANKKASESRDNQAALAATMAGIGAGIAAMSCMELYSAADKAEAAGDAAKAAELRGQAAQQCAQAAQNAANQGQNSGNSGDMQIPNMAASEQQQAPAPTPTPTEEAPPASPAGELGNGFTEPETEIATNESVNGPTAFEQPAAQALTGGEQVASAPSAPKQLPGIENKGITYDEGAESGETGSGTSSSISSGSKLASNSLFDSETQKVTGEGEGHEGSGRRGKNDSSGGGSGTDSSTEPAENSGSSSFRSMLAGLMGGAPAEVAGAGGTGGVLMAGGKGGKKAPNIFEYANYRYRKLQREGEVGKAKPVRNLASTKR